jgi:hypothetical protein
VDTGTCTTTTDCTTKQSGYTSVTHAVTKVNNGAVSGTTSSKMTRDSDGQVLSDCTLDFTWTKQ